MRISTKCNHDLQINDKRYNFRKFRIEFRCENCGQLYTFYYKGTFFSEILRLLVLVILAKLLPFPQLYQNVGGAFIIVLFCQDICVGLFLKKFLASSKFNNVIKIRELDE